MKFEAEISLFCDFTSFLRFSLIFINMQNKLIYISDHRKKGICLSFNLTPILVLYDK